MTDQHVTERSVRVAVLDAHGNHVYLSTYCVHGLSEQCRRTCKTCNAPCVCACHRGGSCAPAYEVVLTAKDLHLVQVTGLVVGEETELGYFSLNELASFAARMEE